MLNFRTPRAKPVIKKSSPRNKGSVVRMLQGIFVMGLGIVFIIANANTGSQYKEISGHIQDSYVHSINGQYDSNILAVNTDPQDLFIFNKNALHPAWNEHYYKGEEIDIHYIDETPKTVVAFQFYDQYGNPLTQYTTSNYQPDQQSKAVTNVGFVIGAALSTIGLLMLGFAIFHARNNKRSKSPGLVSSN